MKYQQIVGQYWKDDKAVYCEGRKIRGANPKTFEVLGDSWAKDDKHAYYAMYMVAKSDPASFVRLNALYAKDKNFAYSAFSHIVKDADPETFEVLDAGIPTEGCFSFTDPVKAGYARDKDHVFYYASTVGKPTIVKDADCETFVSLGNEYGRDSNNVFCEKRKLQGANVSSWRYLGYWYSTDGKKVYFENKASSIVDAGSFILLEPFDGWAKDRNNYYLNGAVTDKSRYIEKLERHKKDIDWIITTVKSGEFDNLHLSHRYNSEKPPKEE